MYHQGCTFWPVVVEDRYSGTYSWSGLGLQRFADLEHGQYLELIAGARRIPSHAPGRLLSCVVDFEMSLGTWTGVFDEICSTLGKRAEFAAAGLVIKEARTSATFK